MQHSKMSRRLVLVSAIAVAAGGFRLASAQPAGPGMMGGGYGPNGRSTLALEAANG